MRRIIVSKPKRAARRGERLIRTSARYMDGNKTAKAARTYYGGV